MLTATNRNSGHTIAAARFMRYAAAGAIGTTVHFLILSILVDALGPLPASTLGACSGCLVNYIVAHKFVFQSDLAMSRSLPRFVAVAAFGVVLNGLLLSLLLAVWPLYFAQTLATASVLVLGFALNSRWSFNAC